MSGVGGRLGGRGQSCAEGRKERMAKGSDENPFDDPVVEELLADEDGGAQ